MSSSIVVGIMVFIIGMLHFTEGSILLVNVRYNKCLSIKDNSNVNGAVLELRDCVCVWAPSWGEEWGETWWTTPTGSPSWLYKLVPGATNKCLTVAEPLGNNGAAVVSWDCATPTVTHQQWKIVNGAYNDQFQIQSVNSGKCITAESTTSIDQWDCGLIPSFVPHQYWKKFTYS